MHEEQDLDAGDARLFGILDAVGVDVEPDEVADHGGQLSDLEHRIAERAGVDCRRGERVDGEGVDGGPVGKTGVERLPRGATIGRFQDAVRRAGIDHRWVERIDGQGAVKDRFGKHQGSRLQVADALPETKRFVAVEA